MDSEKKESKALKYRKDLPQCSQIKKDGTQCKGIASKETGKCPVHSGFKPQLHRDCRLERSVVDVQKFLARTIRSCRNGTITPMTANAVFNGCDKILKTFQIIDIEQKFEELMEQVERQQRMSPDFGESDCLALDESN